MDVGEILTDAVTYPSSEWKKVIILGIFLILSFVIIGIFFVLGYFLRIIKSTIAGVDELPDFDDWGDMFVDGLKVLIVFIIYMLIPGIVIVAGILSSMASLAITNTSLSTAPASVFALIGVTTIIGYILALIFGLFAYMAIANMALYDELGAAFRFGEILDKIKMIGWGNYIIWYIFIWIIAFIIGFITGELNIIPILGTIIAFLVINPYFLMLYARLLGLIYESSLDSQKTENTELTD